MLLLLGIERMQFPTAQSYPCAVQFFLPKSPAVAVVVVSSSTKFMLPGMHSSTPEIAHGSRFQVTYDVSTFSEA